MKIYWYILLSFTFSFAAHAAKPMDAKNRCYKLGDTLLIKGKAPSFMNGGNTIEPLEPVCVHYPKPTSKFNARRLETIGSKVAPDIYLEIKGKLVDPYPIHGVGIEVISTQDIDAEIEAAKQAEADACKVWREKHRANLSKKAHGANVSNHDAGGCCLIAVDLRLPHDLMSICKDQRRRQ